MPGEIEVKARAAMMKLGLHPAEDPMGDDHHTDAPFAPEDDEVAELAFWLGGIFIDVEGHDPDMRVGDSYWYKEMTSHDAWKRVARALRIHGLKIVDADQKE